MRGLTSFAAILVALLVAPPGEASAASGDASYMDALKPGITLQGMRELLGEGYEFYPNLFSFKNGVWASVSAIDRSTVERIITFKYDPPHAMFPKPVIVFNLIEKTKHRRCDQVKVDRKGWTTVAQIDAAWGPPDQIIGSGISYYMYALEDGGSGSWSPNIHDRKRPGMAHLGCFKENGSSK